MPSTILCTRFIGSANPTPLLVLSRLRICVFTPITSPELLSSGPPELPGFTSASVWIMPGASNVGSEVVWISRSSPETMPCVIEKSCPVPKGCPRAIAVMPGTNDELSPNGSVCESSVVGSSIFNTARSACKSAPTSCALYSTPLCVVTVMSSANSASPDRDCTTCAFVTMCP